MLDKIKQQYKDLPHIKEVWIKDDECYLVSVKGATRHSIVNEETVEVNEEETTTIKKSKKK